MSTHVRIERYTSLPSTEALKAGLECVFFTSSNTQVFSSDDARSKFKERWLGRYLQHDPQFAYVALSETDDVVGYLIGSTDDPAITPRFSDLGYVQAFGALSQNYPAHLHVNLAPHHRGGGLGAELIERFVADIRKGSVPGVHVVTTKNARNVGFYNRNGFHEIAANGVGEREVVLLARKL
jgi:GNAT superfamily N-acetyltransferase